MVGGVALIKFTGGSDLLLTVDHEVNVLFIVCIFFDHALNLHLCSFRSSLESLWVSMSFLWASFLVHRFRS